MEEIELKRFLKENSSSLLEFINKEILKDVGEINSNYFNKLIKDIFFNGTNKIEIKNLNLNKLPYQILTFLEGKGKMDYTSMRVDTINLHELNKEASVYYNYAKFYIKDELFFIDLMQMKIGGMPIDEDIVKFSKKIEIKNIKY